MNIILCIFKVKLFFINLFPSISDMILLILLVRRISRISFIFTQILALKNYKFISLNKNCRSRIYEWHELHIYPHCKKLPCKHTLKINWLQNCNA